MLKDFKYYAGLVDADGSLGVHVTKNKDGSFKLYTKFSIELRKDTSWVLDPIAKEFNVNIHYTQREGTNGSGIVSLVGNKAVNMCNQIGKHMVIKNYLAAYVSSINGLLVTQEELNSIRKMIRDLRDNTSESKKNFPSRKWLAGYVDGDGCLGSTYRKRDGHLELRFCQVSHKNDPQGILLIHKHFKGKIYYTHNKMNLVIGFSRLNFKGSLNFLLYFKKHLKIKREQADLIVNCLRTGCHFKLEGATPETNLNIHTALQNMKKPQRLNEYCPRG